MQSSGFSQDSECVLVFRSTKLLPAEWSFRNAQDAFLGKMSCPLGNALETSPWHPPAACLSWVLKTSLANIPTLTTNSCHLADYFHFISLPFMYIFKKIHCVKTHSGVSQLFLTITLVFMRAELRHPLAGGRDWFRVWMGLQCQGQLDPVWVELIHDFE